MDRVEFEVDKAGIVEICKSAGMRSALGAIASGFASAANREAYAFLHEDIHVDAVERMPYGSAVDELDKTCVGVAFTRTSLGGINEARNKSLHKQNH